MKSHLNFCTPHFDFTSIRYSMETIKSEISKLRALERDSCKTKTNEFGEGFLELWGGIPAGLRLMSLERDS